jgi:alpha-glucosidase
MMLLTLRGTTTTYYSEEIGMEDVKIPPEFVQDPPAVNQPEIADIFGREPERTPMQWDAAPNAGFAAKSVQPWLPLADDYVERNVAAQEQDPASMLNLYKALAHLRRAEPALHAGDYASVETRVENVFAYQRALTGHDTFLVALNFGDQDYNLDLSHIAAKAEIEISTDMMRSGLIDLSSLALKPNEGLILRLSS